ncbi:MAG: signal peptidase I [Clostridia bacterium]|nr:signal peptidase I [Clostridia bacterium]
MNKKPKDKPIEKNGSSKLHSTLTVVGIVLCVILVPILIINCTLLIKSVVNENEVPDFGGVMPLIVLTESMAPDIMSGDLIICKTVDTNEIEKGDVISFFDPAGNGTAVVTHKVIDIIINDDGSRSFKTKGINNNIEDSTPVPAGMVVAEYTGIRFAGLGEFAIFMQTTQGLIVCVIIPIILLVGYDLIRRRIYEKNKKDDVAELMAELEALRAVKNDELRIQNESAEEAPENETKKSEETNEE